MLEAVDICIACKGNPHADLFQCGERVVACLHAMLEGRLRPVPSLVKAPVILTGAAETASGPLAEIHGRARQAPAAEPAPRAVRSDRRPGGKTGEKRGNPPGA